MIYFVRAGEDGPVKIGTANNVRRRMMLLQAGNAAALVLLREVDGSHREETWMHHHFRPLRIRAEWFLYDPSMLTINAPWQGPKPTIDDNLAARIVDKFGGATALANLLNCHVTRIYRWTYPVERGGTGGLVPQRHHVALLKLAKHHNVKLRPADLYPRIAA